MTYSPAIFSQIGEGGTPPSFNYQTSLRSAASAKNAPIDFYVEDMREVDYWQARDGAPMPIGVLIPVDYTMDNSGYQTILPGGEKIWQLQIKAKDALALMVYYSDFYIPEGGRLFIYNVDKSRILGAYTHDTHPSGGLFATEFVGGDELILEYVASETSDEKPRIAISELGYGYHAAALREFCNITTRASSGFCEVNINCEEGKAWQNEKKGVCYTVQKIGNKAYICTGTLMNNTAEDFKPIILTALHCAYSGTTRASEDDLKQWMFYFHREREECNDNSNTTVTKSMTGCKMLASTGLDGGSDGLLLLLQDTIPEGFDVFYNGWDYSGDAAKSGVCIHHPQGDYKKISTYESEIKTYTFMATEFTGESNAHWNAVFVSTPNGYGVTESGSSGSPLFNENKLVVGTLSGGNSSCLIQNGFNLYGKFSYHWNRYKADSTHMDVWLDPLNKSTKTLSGRYRKILRPSPSDLKAVYLGQSVSLAWDAPKNSENPNHYNVYRNNVKIEETTALSYLDKDPIYGSIVYSVSAVYDDDNESAFATIALSIIKYKPPSNLKASRFSDNISQVEISWDAPFYEQTIFWGTMTPMFMIGFDEKVPFYFGQKWTAGEIAPLHQKPITAVQFYPLITNSYEIYITQGGVTYRQPIESSKLKANELNTVKLNTPFVINGSNSLIVSIYVSKVVSSYPAVCDTGPAVNGKGNLCGFYDDESDDIEWELLNDNEEPGEYDYNFILSAIITSDTGELPIQTTSKVSSARTTSFMTDHNMLPRKAVLPVATAGNSLRNAVPAPFPEITRYRIYKNGSAYQHLNVTAHSFIERYFSNNDYYEMTALYDQVETERTDKVHIRFVDVISDNELPTYSVQVSPTVFKESVLLQGSEWVTRVEVIAVSGKVSLVVNQPTQWINTSSLAPGLYFFRITDLYGRQTVVKAVKGG